MPIYRDDTMPSIDAEDPNVEAQLIQDRIDEIREETKRDAQEKLAKYHKIMIIRPTGYGKTYLLADFMRSYKHVLYLYPSVAVANSMRERAVENYVIDCDDEDSDTEFDMETVTTIREAQSFNNVDTMTYAKLIRLDPELFKSWDYDCVICDEAHRLGADRTSAAISDLLAFMPTQFDLIGATATPERMDGRDVISTFFSCVTSFPYTLHDAILDGLLQRPYYCYCTYDIEKDITDAMKAGGEKISDPIVTEVINKRLIEISTIYNMENIIQNVCTSYSQNMPFGTNCMKFIAFFSSIKHMNSKLDEVVDWFKNAFPTHTVKTLKISSSNTYEQKNVNKLNKLVQAPNTIYIIACIDMLNLGYHVSDLTGVIMYRGTQSNIIYIQQLGRALSSGAAHSAIVFDVVDNLHRKALYDLPRARKTKTTTKGTGKPTNKTAVKRTIWHVDDTGTIVTDDGHPAPIQLQADGTITDKYGTVDNMFVNPDDNFVYTLPLSDIDNWWSGGGNTLTGDDVEDVTPVFDVPELYAEGHKATYKEIIKKVVAEPMLHRCQKAIEIHFHHWLQSHGIPSFYGRNAHELASLYGLDMDEFKTKFAEMLKNAQIGYPINDLEELCKNNDDNDPDYIPLSVCAKSRQVRLEFILEQLGFTDYADYIYDMTSPASIGIDESGDFVTMDNKKLLETHYDKLSKKKMRDYKIDYLLTNLSKIPVDDNDLEDACIAIQDALLDKGIKIKPYDDGSSNWKVEDKSADSEDDDETGETSDAA